MMSNKDKRLSREQGESEASYIVRVCDSKQRHNLTWQQVADTINAELNLSYSESFYRKNYARGVFHEEMLEQMEDDADYEEVVTVPEVEDSNKKLLRDLVSERIRISDERIQVRSDLRRISRENTIQQIAHDYATQIKNRVLLDFPTDIWEPFATEKCGILLLSDWHYGMVCDNAWNTFNPEVCKDRVRTLLEKTITLVQENEVQEVVVLNLSDLIAGRIHSQIRIQSQFDVISQIMDVGEILSEFLNELSFYVRIRYYDCLDNHSRLEADKRESMDLESLVRIIPWFLKERLRGNSNISVEGNKFGEDIITCEVLGHKVIGVHGHEDKPTSAIEKLSLLTGSTYDLLCTAHLHHFYMDEQCGCLIVSNASLMGVDDYAKKLRVRSEPSQTFIVATNENVCYNVYRITL